MEDLKSLAKEAKKRMKSGFWTENRDKVVAFKNTFRADGMSSSKVVQYYQAQTNGVSKPKKDENELFYTKVKKILDSVGEVSDIIGRLIEREIYDSLPYERKQKYIMDLAAKYRTALERYKKEKNLSI